MDVDENASIRTVYKWMYNNIHGRNKNTGEVNNAVTKYVLRYDDGAQIIITKNGMRTEIYQLKLLKSVLGIILKDKVKNDT
jgi:hypothetical protein